MYLSTSITMAVLTGVSLVSSRPTDNPAAVAMAPLGAIRAADIVEIQQVTSLFAIAVDQQVYNLLPDVFTQDVTVNFNVPDGQILHGLDAVDHFLKVRTSGSRCSHDQTTNHVTFSGVADAHSITYNIGTFFGSGPPAGQRYTNWGRYVS